MSDSITITFLDRETAEAYKSAMLQLSSTLKAETRITPETYIARKNAEYKWDEYAEGLFNAIGMAIFSENNEPISK